MDRIQLEAQLIRDEAQILHVYRDTRGNLIVGIGHLVANTDHLRFGNYITIERARKLFEADLDRALEECAELFPKFNTLPEPVQEILANMMFSMNVIKMRRFTHFIKA